MFGLVDTFLVFLLGAEIGRFRRPVSTTARGGDAAADSGTRSAPVPSWWRTI